MANFKYTPTMLNSEQNPEECDTTDDASSTAAGYLILLLIGLTISPNGG